MTTLSRTLALTGLLLSTQGIALAAQNPVFPGDPFWQADNRGFGTSAITGTNPRLGNGSLELAVTGQLTDWAFFRRVSGDSLSSGWGLLDNLNRLQFDWYRQALPLAVTDVPWLAQTPVLRLFLRHGLGATATFSELVWEKFYTDNTPAVTNTWVSQNLTDQMFWRFVQGANSGYTIGDCSTVDPFFPNPLKTATPLGWVNDPLCPLAGATVWGVSLGVGSAWPDQYTGFVDNVQLGFADNQNLTVHDNFELPSTPVPEPSTIILLATGLAVLAVAGWIRSRKAEG